MHATARPSAGARVRKRDPFGLDPEFRRQALPAVEWLYRRYWRVSVEGLEHVPGSGRVLIVGNHSGGVPFDAMMLAAALELEHPQKRVLRFLYDRFVDALPPVARAYTRLGAVPASVDNGIALLRRNAAVGIFPEGVEGIGKSMLRRYQLQKFRTGFVRMSVATRAPIVPVVIVGAEETYPVIGRWRPQGLLKSLLDVPFVPITPLFPLLGPLGVLPLPTRWHIRFAEPISLHEGLRSQTLTRRKASELAEVLRKRMQILLHEGLARRERLF